MVLLVFQDGDRMILNAPGSKRCMIWLLIDISSSIVFSFSPDCLNGCLEVLSNGSWLHGSEASMSNTDAVESITMMMMMFKRVRNIQSDVDKTPAHLTTFP
ncbi:hypothetical protein T265_01320 [Opisthorchis viverrini]|uniref:Uncharacterized protein n=1 Tax=Opisthorchis viverrini TaxID=6198 RepID=A0A074ZYV3_OPIVI|nr:hypothetical protein T265_01320 [Opisthorchis viverrini]KER32633.1 hypothetical protein T265_01320 [Opisthorchis viverrini]